MYFFSWPWSRAFHSVGKLLKKSHFPTNASEDYLWSIFNIFGFRSSNIFLKLNKYLKKFFGVKFKVRHFCLIFKHCSSVQKLGIEQRINLIPKHDPLQLEQIAFCIRQESFISLQKIHELFMNWQKLFLDVHKSCKHYYTQWSWP